MLEAVQQIAALIDDANRIYESTATWQVKYLLIFDLRIPSAIRAAGLCFDWYNPDGTEEEDTHALMAALREFKATLGNLVV